MLVKKQETGKTDAKGVLTWIAKNRNKKKLTDIGEILKEQIDVRLFGGISTLKNDETTKIKVNGKECSNGHVQFTGPVQFALLNPSLNEVNLRMHQNTTHFTSKAENEQGSIGTTTLVPYSLIQIHGWINSKIAEKTGMTPEDLKHMYEGLWYGTSGDGSSHSRSKIGQNSILLLEIVYAKSNQKVYEVDRLIKLKPKDNKAGEQIRSMDDYTLEFDKLIEIAKTDKIKEIKFYTEIESIKSKLTEKEKIIAMGL